MDSDTRPREAEDLDEDLFNFGELYEDDEPRPSEEIDIDAFLAAADEDADDEPPAHQAAIDVEVDPSLLELPSSEDLERLVRAATEAGGDDGQLMRLVKLGGIALIAINLLAVIAVFASRSGDSNRLELLQREFEQTARELRRDVGLQVDSIRGIGGPTAVVPMALEPEAFDRVRRALDEGKLSSARRQLYAALSTVDRLEPDERRALEAEASFLLADTYRIEAARREEQSREESR